MNTVLVIPARYASTRLPGKPLRLLAGKPLIQHVHERALAAGFSSVLVATDDERIQAVCEGFGAQVAMTATTHETGSDRLAEVVQQQGWTDDTVVVNLQGDEPLTPVANLYQLAANMAKFSEASIATLATPITEIDELFDPNVVKVVRDERGMALYFSRAPVPFQRDAGIAVADYALRHIGMYAYRVGFLRVFTRLAMSMPERLEKLEQLRALSNGYRIHVDIAAEIPGLGVDTEADLYKVEAQLLKNT
ncbi:3-deoxy-manno-octulosonate cytidylyltransferase [Thiothrix unzii]|jgi:3-deoxy-manno-octulosonate cytidylyltransferase (CMP-KDO synthetase)|uniref:3-deoxy-manno-octulosonate cytidylyltransferase n=1 Tax=Thiothrix unzii TaxID=111769 RepID=UPI002A35A4F4|nr:3-deoxy-manno-octulosonate cytidylyltransferase [Thiothrix unzii]MDX9987941.1 3-deoxy-manno-octulosonate cytidylyltransferase [Thiothrix unzii]